LNIRDSVSALAYWIFPPEARDKKLLKKLDAVAGRVLKKR
jgi:hypothetical protein